MTVTSKHQALKQMASGRVLDIAHPDWRQIDFRQDVAPSLARICRYGGAMQCAPYSVAQHCTIMARHALDEYGDAWLAACCLLHDAHEAYCDDETRPRSSAVDIVARELMPAAPRPSKFVEALKARLDKAIFKAAQIAMPQTATLEVVHRLDIAMLETERRHILAPSSKPWPGMENVKPLKLTGAIKPWPTLKAEMEWLDMFTMLCPSALTPQENF